MLKWGNKMPNLQARKAATRTTVSSLPLRIALFIVAKWAITKEAVEVQAGAWASETSAASASIHQLESGAPTAKTVLKQWRTTRKPHRSTPTKLHAQTTLYIQTWRSDGDLRNMARSWMIQCAQRSITNRKCRIRAESKKWTSRISCSRASTTKTNKKPQPLPLSPRRPRPSS